VNLWNRGRFAAGGDSPRGTLAQPGGRGETLSIPVARTPGPGPASTNYLPPDTFWRKLTGLTASFCCFFSAL
jgi:hypothetical protein